VRLRKKIVSPYLSHRKKGETSCGSQSRCLAPRGRLRRPRGDNSRLHQRVFRARKPKVLVYNRKKKVLVRKRRKPLAPRRKKGRRHGRHWHVREWRRERGGTCTRFSGGGRCDRWEKEQRVGIKKTQQGRGVQRVPVQEKILLEEGKKGRLEEDRKLKNFILPLQTRKTCSLEKGAMDPKRRVLEALRGMTTSARRNLLRFGKGRTCEIFVYRGKEDLREETRRGILMYRTKKLGGRRPHLCGGKNGAEKGDRPAPRPKRSHHFVPNV